jgi:hypothetical protein
MSFIGVVENCGKFSHVVAPGLNCLQWPFEAVSATLSLKIQQLEISCDTKSKDNVFVQVVVTVQYKVVEDKVCYNIYHLFLVTPRFRLLSNCFFHQSLQRVSMCLQLNCFNCRIFQTFS